MSYAIIIPARNEEASLGPVIAELHDALAGLPIVIAVGVNGSEDASARVAGAHGATVGETGNVGYGHGCLAAIRALEKTGAPVHAFIFVSGDGSNDPADVRRLIEESERHDASMVIGQRTLRRENWGFGIFGPRRALPNVTLGLWTTFLTGHPFCDIGPLRLIERDLFAQLALREMTWGWTIEAQVVACRLGVRVHRISVTERPRLAGLQKVSAVSWQQSLRIGLSIAAAGWRARFRPLGPKTAANSPPPPEAW